MSAVRNLLICMLVLFAIPALAQTNTCTMIATGTAPEITAYGNCYKVTNNSGLTVCATTGLAANWTGGNSFTSNPPPGVSIAACGGASCSYWGGTLAHGASSNTPTRYAENSVPPLSCGYGYTCADIRVTAYCNNGVTTCGMAMGGGVNCASLYSSCTAVCFTRDTPITMADGSTKRVADLRVGDMVRGHTRNNKVLKVPSPLIDQAIYGFNGGKAFVTGGHPFMTQDGWKAIDPSLTPLEGHAIKVGRLKVGDVLVAPDGSQVLLRTITAEYPGTMTVYNPMVDGDDTYYANGLLAHNKECP